MLGVRLGPLGMRLGSLGMSLGELGASFGGLGEFARRNGLRLRGSLVGKNEPIEEFGGYEKDFNISDCSAAT